MLTCSAGGCNIEGEDDSYDFGSGAGFYVDATEEKWKTNYRMYSYVTSELRQLVDKYFNTSGKQSITGHRFVIAEHTQYAAFIGRAMFVVSLYVAQSTLKPTTKTYA